MTVEETREFSAELPAMEDVWSFVMRYLDVLDGPPTVQIWPCSGHEDDDGLHFHVSVSVRAEVES